MNASVQSNYYLSPLPNSVLDESIGAFLIGTLLGLTLYGMVVHQTYQYFHRYKDNDIYVRSFVTCIFITETVHIVACVHSCYYYLVSNYGRPSTLSLPIWSLKLQPMQCALEIAVAQGFYARRAYILRPKSRPLVALAVAFSMAVFGLGLASTVKITPDPVGYLTPEFLNIAVAGAAVVSDLLTTGIFITSLKNSRTGFRQTDRMLDRLIRYAVYTGVLTGVLNMLSIALMILFSSILLSTAIAIIVTKVYGVSVLAVLHTRRSSIEVAERGQRERIGIHVIATGTRTSSTLEDFGHIQVSHGRSDSIVTKANRAESA